MNKVNGSIPIMVALKKLNPKNLLKSNLLVLNEQMIENVNVVLIIYVYNYIELQTISKHYY